MTRPKRAPIWTSPAPGARQPRLTREEIAATALAIADREGFDAVSMRRIATELGTGTMTLYYYVRTKADLITLVDDAIMAECILPAELVPRTWREGLAAVAHATHAAFRRHPWALKFLEGARVGPNNVRHMEQSLAMLDGLAVDVWTKLRMLAIVDDYVFGHALRAGDAAGDTIMDRKMFGEITEYMAGEIEREDHPHLRALFASGTWESVFKKIASAMTDDARFQLGLDALLDGLARTVAAPRRKKPARAKR